MVKNDEKRMVRKPRVLQRTRGDRKILEIKLVGGVGTHPLHAPLILIKE